MDMDMTYWLMLEKKFPNFTVCILDNESPENGKIVFTPEVDGKGGEYNNFTKDDGSSVYPTYKPQSIGPGIKDMTYVWI